jgi:hypothetical protein
VEQDRTLSPAWRRADSHEETPVSPGTHVNPDNAAPWMVRVPSDPWEADA